MLQSGARRMIYHGLPWQEDRMQNYLDFEKGLAELEGKAEELRALARKTPEMDMSEEATALDAKASVLLDDLYKGLDPWRKTQVARHPDRPHCKDYVEALFTDWTPLAGDRNFADDHAIMGGLARFDDRPVVVIGHEKGNDTRSRIQRNFGMARPEGYRKAIRLMDLADRFGLPVVTLIDTPGAYPGKGAEERGQAEAIARATEKCLSLGTPIVSVVIGEGGSGGAVALATADRIAMLEHSIYSVISPEGCASILWKDAERMRDAAAALRLTAQDLKALGVIDRIVLEPRGGAQRDRTETIARVGAAIATMLGEVEGKKPETLRRARRRKYLDMGSKALVA
jgi:acetyl-CoA carboxylase carboxyl transferase subunit alpha